MSVSFLGVPSGLFELKTISPSKPTSDAMSLAKSEMEISSPVYVCITYFIALNKI